MKESAIWSTGSLAAKGNLHLLLRSLWFFSFMHPSQVYAGDSSLRRAGQSACPSGERAGLGCHVWLLRCQRAPIPESHSSKANVWKEKWALCGLFFLVQESQDYMWACGLSRANVFVDIFKSNHWVTGALWLYHESLRASKMDWSLWANQIKCYDCSDSLKAPELE